MGSVLGFGHVVLVDIPDPDGKSCAHPHPAMILRGPDVSGNMKEFVDGERRTNQ